MNSDRYNIQDTPESADEREDAKAAAYERELDRGDRLRDERRDREMEERETAPPVPESLSRTLASHRPARYFRDTTTDDAWEWSGGKMTVNHGEDSIFASPGALLDCPGIIEVDESGEPLKPSAEAVAAEKGDREQQREADES